MTLARMIACFCSLLILSAFAPVKAANTFRIPICANGEITFVYMTFDEKEDAPENHQSACHAVCTLDRRALLVKKRAG